MKIGYKLTSILLTLVMILTAMPNYVFALRPAAYKIQTPSLLALRTGLAGALKRASNAFDTEQSRQPSSNEMTRREFGKATATIAAGVVLSSTPGCGIYDLFCADGVYNVSKGDFFNWLDSYYTDPLSAYRLVRFVGRKTPLPERLFYRYNGVREVAVLDDYIGGHYYAYFTPAERANGLLTEEELGIIFAVFDSLHMRNKLFPRGPLANIFYITTIVPEAQEAAAFASRTKHRIAFVAEYVSILRRLLVGLCSYAQGGGPSKAERYAKLLSSGLNLVSVTSHEIGHHLFYSLPPHLKYIWREMYRNSLESPEPENNFVDAYHIRGRGDAHLYGMTDELEDIATICEAWLRNSPELIEYALEQEENGYPLLMKKVIFVAQLFVDTSAETSLLTGYRRNYSIESQFKPIPIQISLPSQGGAVRREDLIAFYNLYPPVLESSPQTSRYFSPDGAEAYIWRDIKFDLSGYTHMHLLQSRRDTAGGSFKVQLTDDLSDGDSLPETDLGSPFGFLSGPYDFSSGPMVRIPLEQFEEAGIDLSRVNRVVIHYGMTDPSGGTINSEPPADMERPFGIIYFSPEGFDIIENSSAKSLSSFPVLTPVGGLLFHGRVEYSRFQSAA